MSSVTTWVIGREPIRVAGAEALVPLRLPWYRSLPWSSLEALTVTVDGHDVPAGELNIRLDGKALTLADMSGDSETFWFIQDTAFVAVSAVGLGSTARVAVSATFRIPYLMIGPDTALRRVVVDELDLPVVEEAA